MGHYSWGVFLKIAKFFTVKSVIPASFDDEKVVRRWGRTEEAPN
jgi:hypothetical protein